MRSVEDQLLTAEEAALRLKMHPVTVRRLLRQGQLPGRKVGARQWRISAAALASYVESPPASTDDDRPK